MLRRDGRATLRFFIFRGESFRHATKMLHFARYAILGGHFSAPQYFRLDAAFATAERSFRRYFGFRYERLRTYYAAARRRTAGARRRRSQPAADTPSTAARVALLAHFAARQRRVLTPAGHFAFLLVL